MYGDQFGEFVFGYEGSIKGQTQLRPVFPSK